MKKIFHLTEHGKRELEEELQDLVDSRAEIAQRIADARSFGDLSENAEYSTARDAQSRTEARISEIERILASCDIIADNNDGVVSLGDSVVLKSGRQTVEYKIVGAVEADPLNGKVSNESALGKQIMGKKAGDKVTIVTPKGEKTYELLKVQ